MGQLSLCSQVLLLPLGVPILARTCFAQSHEVWRVLNTTADVGNATQGQGTQNWKSSCVPMRRTAQIRTQSKNSGDELKQATFHIGNARILFVFFLNLLFWPCGRMPPRWWVTFRVVTGMPIHDRTLCTRCARAMQKRPLRPMLSWRTGLAFAGAVDSKRCGQCMPAVQGSLRSRWPLGKTRPK